MHSNLSKLLKNIQRTAATGSTNSWEIQQEAESISNTYSQMLRYMLLGVNDPHANELKNKLTIQASQLMTRLNRLRRIENNRMDVFCSTLRTLKGRWTLGALLGKIETNARMIIAAEKEEEDGVDSMEHNKLRNERESYSVQMFDYVWTSDQWNTDDVHCANEFLLSPCVRVKEKALFVSAVTMALQEMFDNKKMMLLFDAYDCHSMAVSQRALTGIILTLYRSYPESMYYPEIHSRLELCSDNKQFATDCYAILTQLQFCAMTTKVSERMRNDIMPKLTEKYKKDSVQETNNTDDSPWMRDMLDGAGDNERDKAIEEFVKMQQEGADVHFSTFSYLKGDSFFNQTAHWFAMFDEDGTLMDSIRDKSVDGKNTALIALTHNPSLCNSDIHSIMITFRSLGAMTNIKMEEQLSRMFNEQDPEALQHLMTRKLNRQEHARKAIFDLYRFYKLYKYRPQFTDVFKLSEERPFSPIQIKELDFMLDRRDLTLCFIDFCIHQEMYQEAADLILAVSPKYDADDIKLWQKLGYCYHKCSNTQEAMRIYELANEICPGSRWTMSHIAALAFETEQYDKASDFYATLLEADENNVVYLYRLGVSLMQKGKYEEALKILYKGYYYNPDDEDICRKLAVCSMITGNTSEAISYIPQSTDEQTIILTAVCQLLTDGAMVAYDLLCSISDSSTFNDNYSAATRMLAASDHKLHERIQMLYDAVIFKALS